MDGITQLLVKYESGTPVRHRTPVRHSGPVRHPSASASGSYPIRSYVWVAGVSNIIHWVGMLARLKLCVPLLRSGSCRANEISIYLLGGGALLNSRADGGLDSRVCLRTLPVMAALPVEPAVASSPLLSLMVEHLKERKFSH